MANTRFDPNILNPLSFDQLELDRDDGLAALQNLSLALKRCSVALGKHGVSVDLRNDWGYSDGDHAPIILKVMKRLDVSLWTEAIAAAGVDSIMTHGDAKLMRKKVEDESPPFTATQARQLVGSLVHSSGKLAMNSVRQVFDRLIEAKFRRGGGRNWKAESQAQNARKIEPRFRVSLFWGGMPEYWYSSDADANAFLNDLELVSLLVNDQPRPKYPHRLADRMVEDYRNTKAMVAVTPYFSVELFKNGNAIIKFTDQTTLDRLNAWGSDGSKIPEAKEA